ncbi:MAG TPA: fatty acid desaturase [Thermoanaerobaculia bacterium]|nr:fatty acid desaturase [Thermoanaerobaculia bacterium]
MTGSRYYADHTVSLRSELGRFVPVEELRLLHRKRPMLHLFIALCLFAALAGSTAAIVLLDRWFLWLPFALVSGFAIFNCTILLHEVVHRAALGEVSDRWNRILGIVYAVPSGISAMQFTRWHLDHHAALGSDDEDPKRHHLSPKINARWLKLLYFTPALFPIYFRAAKQEGQTYPAELKRAIARERTATIILHLALLGFIVWFFGWMIAWKAYLVPYFFIFPVAFALNRLGQHYDVDPTDPAKWSTLMRGSWFWDFVYLFSNYHLEHHYFPSVPFYNLPRLQKLLLPFYRERGIVMHGYGELIWHYLVLNRQPHTNWHEEPSPEAVATAK